MGSQLSPSRNKVLKLGHGAKEAGDRGFVAERRLKKGGDHGPAVVGWPGGKGTPLMEPGKWHFKHAEKWKAPEPLTPAMLGWGLLGSLPSWHWTQAAMGGALMLRRLPDCSVLMWH